MTTDEERWAQAEEILRNGPGPDARRRMRQRKILFWSLLGGSLLLGFVVAFVVALLVGPHHHRHADRPLWQAIAEVGFGVAGIVVIGIALWVMWRSGRLRNPWQSPQSVLTWRQRRELSRQVLGKAAVDPARLPLARDLAERAALGYRNLLLIFLGVLLTYAGQLFSGRTGWHLWLPLASIALWLIAMPLALRNSRRMQRFLAEHPAEDG